MVGRINVGYCPLLAETTVPVAVADGAEVNPWYDEYGRPVNKGYNLGAGAMDVNEVAHPITQVFTHVFTQLTAVGNTAAIDVSVYHHHTFQVVVAAINTSVDVIVQGSNDGTHFFNMDDTGVVTQYVANDTYLLHKDNFKCLQVRFRMDAEVGGAAVTLDVTYFGGN